ncbi:Uncharacterised protein [Mycobacteroides abscessus subsp. abscessus]|nr:Uncharacterised protein [Mycobacteroides abscessus subsp. abscessus]SHV77267.1 Uncharacterised protein [Mycobacteroides abscessus subsp. abscessus]SHY53463.1 Uncharacterised protein [Mycobacteroides abscessus subsp. abscessus]SHZ44005.1 Uncharacterised protein [Mycobacteroides abscessus subsp. abscessus]SHZ68211.1 Uncharacterised protein [Mycobacteroides abscessus subsp. abscessus]
MQCWQNAGARQKQTVTSGYAKTQLRTRTWAGHAHGRKDRMGGNAA